MADLLEQQLERWLRAGAIDPAAASRIRALEAPGAGAGKSRPPRPGRWAVAVATSAGALMVTAGLLLFVAARWSDLTPAAQLGILVAAVLGLHAAGATVRRRLPVLGGALHAAGSASLGGVIFQAGHLLHLDAAWSTGYLLWALGAWLGYAWLRDWPQALLAALLTPAWLVAEWVGHVRRFHSSDASVVAAGLTLLAVVYLLADGRGDRGRIRTALAVTGAILVLPLAAFTMVGISEVRWHWDPVPSLAHRAFWWVVALAGPVSLALVLRGRAAWQAAVAALWVVVGVLLGPHPGALAYLWGGVGALGLTASGAVDASRRRINLGLAGFALTVVVFYFSSALDRLGRATSLLAGGLLFLGLGWTLERTRRRLVARVEADPTG